MARQNRVDPFGALIAHPARGAWTGNRGCLHDDAGRIRRPFQGNRWIYCLLEFKGRRRTLMSPGRYTELFFLDEATALAAGHRPCAECQRPRFNLFRQMWAAANPQLNLPRQPSVAQIDAVLHRERTAPHPDATESSRGWLAPADAARLPDGVFVTPVETGGEYKYTGQPPAYLARDNRLWQWTPDGYHLPSHAPSGVLRILTQPSIVRLLSAGFAAGVDRSAR